MIAVLGSQISQINLLLNERKNNSGICEIANDNATGQIIMSGDKASVSQFQIILKEKKIKSIPLKVSAPFHCSLMRTAAEKMKDKINEVVFTTPKFKIIANVNAKPYENTAKIKELLINQIYSSVKWRETLLNMSNNGVKNFVEIGPGKVLSGMVKRTIKNANCFSINSLADIKNLQDELKR